MLKIENKGYPLGVPADFVWIHMSCIIISYNNTNTEQYQGLQYN